MSGLKRKFSCSGFTLVEVLIASAILGIILFALTSYMSFQLTQQRRLTQKYAVLSLGNLIQSTLTDPANCPCQFPGTFDETLTNPSLKMDKVLASCQPGSGTLVGKGSELVNSAGLTPSSVAFTNIKLAGGNQYTGTVEVDFDPSSVAGPLRPLQIPLRVFTSQLAPKKTKINGCINTAPSLGSICSSLGGTFNAQTQSCSFSGQTQCANLGGTWINGKGCELQAPCGPLDPNSMIWQQCYGNLANPGQVVCTPSGWVCNPGNASGF